MRPRLSLREVVLKDFEMLSLAEELANGLHKAIILDQLIEEAKEIIDHPDGYDMLFDFVLGVAGLDGDPEYQ